MYFLQDDNKEQAELGSLLWKRNMLHITRYFCALWRIAITYYSQNKTYYSLLWE